MEQLSYFHQPLAEPLDHRTLSQLLHNQAEKNPQREAIVLYDEAYQRHSMTFGEYKSKSQALAAALVEKGLKRGDRVCLVSPNNLEIAICFMALNSIGANIVLLPQGLASEDLIDAMTHLKCVGMVCYLDDEERKKKPVVDALNEVLKESLPQSGPSFVKVVVTISSGAKWISGIRSDCIHSYSELIRYGDSRDPALLHAMQSKVQFDDPAVILFSSGSTGEPKACQFTHQAIVFGARTVASNFMIDTNSECRTFNDVPFSWCPGTSVGFAFSALGITSINIPPVVTVCDRSTNFTLQVLSKEECTCALLFPYLLHDFVAEGSLINSYDLHRLRVALTGGQNVPEDLTRKVFKVLPNLQLGVVYASTETYSMVLHETCVKENVNCDTYGWLEVDRGVEIKIVDDEDRVLPVGSTGEICVRGPMLFLEYLDSPESTARTKSRTGWYHTSDAGIMDGKGRVKIFGRKGNAINRGTDTFYLDYFEKIIAQHSLVASNIIIGVPDQRLQEEMCACVILREDEDREAKKSELEKWYDKEWPPNADGLSWKPGYTIFLKEFPKTRTGKPDRRALRQIAINELELENQD